MISELVLASGNRGKLSEMQSLLGPAGIKVRTLADFSQEQADETGLSFVENAIIKARHAAALSGLPALADDSGLEVDALHGRPGVYSARFAGPDADDAANNRRLLEEMVGIDAAQRTARFHCVMALMRSASDPVPLICAASWEGRILESPRGEQGFGYDPLFLVPALGRTSAELERSEKNRLSHRGQALAKLLTLLGQPSASAL
jgi:XTP/dITP diphosphohydrolase